MQNHHEVSSASQRAIEMWGDKASPTVTGWVVTEPLPREAGGAIVEMCVSGCPEQMYIMPHYLGSFGDLGQGIYAIALKRLQACPDRNKF